MIPPTHIVSRVSALMEEKGLTLRHCNESGSRAWGLASTDSDYDVRFIYQHPREWYLQLGQPKDMIGPLMELDGELDMAGWDLRKVLAHVAKSNPGVLEWLYSPITYYVDEPFLAEMRRLATVYFQPHRVVAHYLGIARSARLAGYDEADGTWNLKKFCYYIRPTLAARHVLAHGDMPSVAFADLVEEIEDTEIVTLIEELVTRKATVGEGHREVLVEELVTYFNGLRAEASLGLDALELNKVGLGEIEAFFRETIGYS